MPASDSGENRATRGIAPSGQMLLNAFGIVIFALACWNIYETSQLDTKYAAGEQRMNNQDKEMAEFKKTQSNTESRLEAWMNKLSDKIDRLSEKLNKP